MGKKAPNLEKRGSAKLEGVKGVPVTGRGGQQISKIKNPNA